MASTATGRPSASHVAALRDSPGATRASVPWPGRAASPSAVIAPTSPSSVTRSESTRLALACVSGDTGPSFVHNCCQPARRAATAVPCGETASRPSPADRLAGSFAAVCLTLLPAAMPQDADALTDEKQVGFANRRVAAVVTPTRRHHEDERSSPELSQRSGPRSWSTSSSLNRPHSRMCACKCLRRGDPLRSKLAPEERKNPWRISNRSAHGPSHKSLRRRSICSTWRTCLEAGSAPDG